MSDIEKRKTEGATTEEFGKAEEPTKDACADINDPLRRTLCKVCQAPVIGAAPFCQEHEPPVP